MNTDDRILQILENSACLSKGQLTGYIRHTLYPEELRAVELHLSSCALCNDALEGLETQQDVDKLITSMIPPVLPAIIPKEKPKEKKETPLAIRTEQTETRRNPFKNTHQAPDEQRNKNENIITTQVFRARNLWIKPLGIAAALVLVFGALWYFKFNRVDQGKQLAQRQAVPPEKQIPHQDTDQAALVADATTLETQKKSEEKKQKDSLYIVRRTEARLKAKRDSTALAFESQDTEKKASALPSALAASKNVAADREAEQSEVSSKKSSAPTPARDQEDTKKEATDYEIGLQKYKEKNYASALLYFKSAESDKRDPKHWDAVYYSALCNRNLNKDRKARKLFERIVDAAAPQMKSAQKQLDDMKKKKDE